MEPYRPSGRSDPGALIILFLCTVITGGVAGAIVHVIGLWYRIALIYSLAISIVVGRSAMFVVERCHIRAPATAALLAFLGGAIGWSTDMGIDYLRARDSIAVSIAPLIERSELIDRSTSGRAIDFILVKWGRGESVLKGQVLAVLTGRPVSLSPTEVLGVPPVPSFFEAAIGYMQLRASAGTAIVYDEKNVAWQFAAAWSVNKITGKETIEYPKPESVIGKNGTFTLWLLEFLFAASFGAWFAFDRAKEPFCEVCGIWYSSVPVLLKVGALSDKLAIKKELQRLDIDSLCRRMAGQVPETECVVMLCRYCHQCMAAPVATELVAVKGDHRRTLASGLLSSEVLLRLSFAGIKK